MLAFSLALLHLLIASKSIVSLVSVSLHHDNQSHNLCVQVVVLCVLGALVCIQIITTIIMRSNIDNYISYRNSKIF